MRLAGGERASGVEAAHTWGQPWGQPWGWTGLSVYRGSEEQRLSCPSLPLQVIYMARNPKDLVVSYYQFHRSLRTMSYRGTFQEFCRRFMNDKCKCLSVSACAVVGGASWLPVRVLTLCPRRPQFPPGPPRSPSKHAAGARCPADRWRSGAQGCLEARQGS